MRIAKLSFLVAITALLSCSCNSSGDAKQHLIEAQGKFEELQKRLKQGWNTWDVHDVLSQVLLPECLALTYEIAGIRDTVRKPYLGQNWNKEYTVIPNWHSFDGSFTDLTIHWRNARIRVQSAAEGDRLVHENYNPHTGEGTSDDYYHWGGLLGFLTILEIESRN